MKKEQQLSDKVLTRAKKIYELSKAKDIINWYDNLKLSWFENQINKTKQKRNKRFEKEIMNRTALVWDKLQNPTIRANNANQVLVKTKDGRIFLVDEDKLETTEDLQ